MTESLWTATGELPSFPPLEGDTKTEVLIVGGGMAGLLCAYELQQRGMECLLVEAGRICGGVTGNTTAKITSQHGLIYQDLIRRFGRYRAADYYRANQAALRRYRQLAQEFPCDFQEKTAFVYSTEHDGALEAELQALDAIDAEALYRDSIDLPLPVTGAIGFPRQAQFHPLKFAAGLARGLNIREHTRVTGFEGKTALTDRGRITAGRIIIATHFPILNKHGAYFLKMYQHRSYVLGLEGAGEVEGMYIDKSKHGLSFREADGLLLLGGGSHRTGKQGGGWSELKNAAQKYYPGVVARYQWATQDCLTLDDVPYIGQYGRHTPGLYVATGFNKWGMTGAMTAAMILADRIEGRLNPFADVFTPQRTIWRPRLLANAASAVAGLLTFSKPRCPHMGCALKWNPQEHTWDCSCHGSRFASTGEVLDNPANGDIPPKSLT